MMTDTERIAFLGVQERQRAAQIDLHTLLRAIEDRLRLPVGAIGATHQIDTQTWQIIAPAVAPEKANEP